MPRKFVDTNFECGENNWLKNIAIYDLSTYNQLEWAYNSMTEEERQGATQILDILGLLMKKNYEGKYYMPSQTEVWIDEEERYDW